MSNPFPKELQEYFGKQYAYFQAGGHLALLSDDAIIAGIDEAFGNGTYGFEDNLRTGNFTPYAHEHEKLSVHSHNCMTLIPSLYTVFDIAGFNPEIIEFSGFYNPKDDDPVPSDAPHVCVLLNMKDGSQQIVDPYYGLFGRIKEFSDGKLVTAGNYVSRKSKTRIYESVRGISAEEFALMFEELREEGKSLDMLLEGQKFGIASRGYLGFSTSHKMFFLPEEIAIMSRIYYQMEIFSDMFVEATSKFNEDGKRQSVAYEIGFARHPGWIEMEDRTNIATFDHRNYRTLVKLLGSAAKKAERIGERHDETELMDLHQDIMPSELSENALARIRARTVYELMDPKDKYLYTEAERRKMLVEVGNAGLEIRTEMRNIYNNIARHQWKIGDTTEAEHRRLKQMHRKKEKEAGSLDEKIVTVIRMEKKNKARFHRMMDVLLFAEDNALIMDGLYDAFEEEGYDSRIGHLAITADFLPLMKARMHELRFHRHLPVISRKIMARHKNMQASAVA